MTKTNLIRALGLYLIIAVAAATGIEERRFRLAALILVGGVALKTVAAWGREQ